MPRLSRWCGPTENRAGRAHRGDPFGAHWRASGIVPGFTSQPEVIGSSVGLVPTNALVFTNIVSTLGVVGNPEVIPGSDLFRGQVVNTLLYRVRFTGSPVTTFRLTFLSFLIYYMLGKSAKHFRRDAFSHLSSVSRSPVNHLESAVTNLDSETAPNYL